MAWQDDKGWSDRFIPEIQSIMGRLLIREPANFEEDRDRNSDLMVLRLDGARIGCRIRRHDAYLRWPGEFTIRSDRPSGALTERAKIIKGWGDYLFYGFSNEDQTALIDWTVGDLNEFRLWHMSYLANNNGQLPGQENVNNDKGANSSRFVAYRWDSLPDAFVVATKSRFASLPA